MLEVIGILTGVVVGLAVGLLIGSRLLLGRRPAAAPAEAGQEVKDTRAEAIKAEERMRTKEQELDRKLLELERREQGFADRETHVRQLQEELKAAKEAELRELERVAGLSQETAKK